MGRNNLNFRVWPPTRDMIALFPPIKKNHSCEFEHWVGDRVYWGYISKRQKTVVVGSKPNPYRKVK